MAVGSDTPQDLMATLFSSIGDAAVGATTGGLSANTPGCDDGTNYSAATLAPDGSTAGMFAPAQEEQAPPDEQGCVAIDSVPPTYQAALALVGFANAAGGRASGLCSAQDGAAITAAGFVPLGTSGGSTGSDLAGATCRAFAGTTGP
jgi:hypothetical protein